MSVKKEVLDKLAKEQGVASWNLYKESLCKELQDGLKLVERGIDKTEAAVQEKTKKAFKKWHNQIINDPVLLGRDKLNRHWALQHLEDYLFSEKRGNRK